MPVHRIIFRLDYLINYEIIDRPGTVMRILDNNPKEYWREIRENHDNRQIMGAKKIVILPVVYLLSQQQYMAQ
jgi:hypothetical protein